MSKTVKGQDMLAIVEGLGRVTLPDLWWPLASYSDRFFEIAKIASSSLAYLGHLIVHRLRGGRNL